jgi:voltage-gated potassium channel
MIQLNRKLNFGVNISAYCGMGGIANRESRLAQIAEYSFSIGLIAIAFLLLISWQKQLLGPDTSRDHMLISAIVWGYLLIQTLVMCLLVRSAIEFLKTNWLLPVVLVLGWIYMPLYHMGYAPWLRDLQLILALCLLTPSLGLLVHFLIDGKLSTTLWASLFVVILFGLLVAGVDPSIPNFWDGIWWALATVSTVGYGDVAPTSFIGRLLGGGLILLGMAIFITLTANYLAWLLERQSNSSNRKAAAAMGAVPPTTTNCSCTCSKDMKALTKEMKEMTKAVDTLSNQVKKLEK